MNKECVEERVEKALGILEEVCDTACIIVTIHDNEKGETNKYHKSIGNVYAVEGSILELADSL